MEPEDEGDRHNERSGIANMKLFITWSNGDVEEKEVEPEFEEFFKKKVGGDLWGETFWANEKEIYNLEFIRKFELKK